MKRFVTLVFSEWLHLIIGAAGGKLWRE
jgi:hypothetical protein